MPRSQPQLAKLTRPRSHNAVARERLFALLDCAREERGALCRLPPPPARCGGCRPRPACASRVDVYAECLFHTHERGPR
jgi:hypothetical protein